MLALYVCWCLAANKGLIIAFINAHFLQTINKSMWYINIFSNNQVLQF